MDAITVALQGGCKCGDVTYEIHGTPIEFVQCDCPQCRRTSGADSASTLIVERADFRWLRGEALVLVTRNINKGRVEKVSADSAHGSRSSCRRCGSELPRIHPELPVVLVPAESLASDSGLQPTVRQVISNANELEFFEELTQHAEAPPNG